MVPKRAFILEQLKQTLDPERFKHSLRVERTAVDLARKHGVSLNKAGLAGLLHDCARKYSRKGLLKEAKRHKLKIDPISRFEPKLLHAELSALMARQGFGVKSKDVLKAIEKHTVGSPGMTRLEKIIYLADHMEEGRDFSGVKKVRRLAFRELDQAVIESASLMLKFLLAKKLPIDPGTTQTRNYYLLKT